MIYRITAIKITNTRFKDIAYLRFSMCLRLLLLLICITPVILNAQSGNLRSYSIKASSSIIKIDTLSIYPNSFYAIWNGDTLSKNDYFLDYTRSTFQWLRKDTGLVMLHYRVLPFDFSRSYKRYDTTLLSIKSNDERDKFKISNSYSVNDVFGGQELAKNGSISRGVSFGNRQDLGINSALNLELSGNLSPNLKVLAAVSDANIPIQPNGNTNKLQEFDQVFIQVFNEQFKLTVGDFWLSKPDGFFMNYKKRAQGLSIENRWSLENEKYWKTQASAALSKGKFNRQVIVGIESNQGPYRLRGNENEPFILVLAGTERIYIDGRLLERGQEYDYVMDYNTSELTFTARNLITKDSRIVAEFQYSDQNYARSLIQSATSYHGKKLDFWLNAYSEQDAKNQSLQQNLSPSQKFYLSTIGDNLDLAKVSSIDSIGYFDNQVLYKMIDSLAYDSVLVFSVQPDSAIYRAVFQYIGANKGNYILNNYNALGKVFRWVAPVGGIPQGDFQPSRLIITPKQKQLFTSGFRYQLSKNIKIDSEIALSSEDLNTFSNLGNNNNLGLAQRSKITQSRILGDSSKGWEIENKIEYEYLHANFSPIEQYRSVEFDRDWNTRNKGYQGQQGVGQISSKLKNKSYGFINLSGQSYAFGKDYLGNRIYSDGKWNQGGWSANWNGSYLSSKNTGGNQFFRHRVDINKKIGGLRLGYRDDHEKNTFTDSSQVITKNSYQFFDYEIYLASSDTSSSTFKFYYRERYDQRADSTSLRAAAKARTLGGEISLKKLKDQRLTLIGGYRTLAITDSSLINQSPENSLIGRIDYEARWFKNALNWSTFYEVGSGLEQKRTFIYIKVNDGQGVYTWVDYNNDGVKDLNEFEIAQYVDQASYIRIFTPSNDYVKTYSNELNQGIFWRPEKIWAKKKGFLGLMAKFSNQTRIRINQKTSLFDPSTFFNPFANAIADTNLLSTGALIRNALYFNRTSNVINAEYTYQDSKNKSLLASGFDSKRNKYHEIFTRWNIIPTFSIELKGQKGAKSAFADYTTNRNYSFGYQSLLASFIYQASTNYRLTLDGRIIDKKNASNLGGETCLLKEIGGSFKYNQTEKGSVQGAVKAISMGYTGNPNSAVGFEMLESLRPGINYTWNLSYQRTLSKNLQLNIQYLGRKSETIRTIHSGSMEVRAYF